MSLRALLSLMVLIPALPARADTVWLNNGDRLSGEVLLLDGGKLALRTPYAGRVLIDWKDIDTLATGKPLMLRRSGLDSEGARTLQAVGQGMVRLVDGGSETVALSSIERLVPPRPLLKDRVWEGNLDAKLDMQRNQDSSDEWKLKGDTRIEHGRWRHVLRGELEHEQENGEKTEDNWSLEYDLDRFLDDHWFWRAGYEQSVDQFEALSRLRIIGTGPGYRFWDNELGRLDLVTQFNRVELDSALGDARFDSWSLEWDYKRLLWGTRLEFYSTAEVHLPQAAQIDYVFDGEAGLRYRLNDWARLSLLYELNQLRGLGTTLSDRHYLIGLGVGW
ncbi:DUF481 domain-containing protein [Pseudomonas sp. CAU 1711]|uniref:DUF481 domain-containing protein n=1 Tax=Pseudomonas sp. CAU 1711 TaxID=3140356 RepID=UPI003261135D